MVAESVRPKPTETYREDYKICSRCNFKIASQHFFANPQNENTPMNAPRRKLQRLDSLLRLMTMTNSRCFRIDLKLNRFVTSTKCNSTKVLSAVSAHEEPTPPDCTTPRSQIGNAGAMPVQKAPGMNPEPHQSRSRCFQISPSRGLTPLTARDERVHPISMWVIVSHFQCSEPKTSRIYPKLLSRHKSLKALRAICTLPQPHNQSSDPKPHTALHHFHFEGLVLFHRL